MDINTGSKVVRWGVLSAANIAVKSVIPAIASARNGAFMAIASRESDRASSIAARYTGAHACASYDALLDDPEVDAVYIPLPNALHAEWSIRATQHGKHVLCEKPLAFHPAPVHDMFAAARQSGVVLMEAFMYRLHPQMQWVLQQIEAGTIGQVHVVRSAFGFDLSKRTTDIRLSAALEGGSMMDVGCYPLSLCRAVYGQPVRSARAQVSVPAGFEVELATAAVLDFGDGRTGVMDCSFMVPWHQFADITGEQGRIILNRPFTPGKSDTVVRIERGDEVTERRFAGVDQYQLEIEHFGDCVLNGTPLLISEADALAQAEAIETIYAAAGYQLHR